VIMVRWSCDDSKIVLWFGQITIIDDHVIMLVKKLIK
jgi:hypothetical protein